MNDQLSENKNKKKKKDPPSYKGKGEKFYFNMNYFEKGNDGSADQEEEDIPPPPTYSEEELQAAKDQAFHNGMNEGLRESSESREQMLAGIMDQLTESLSTLFDQEEAREKRFEKEAVNLSLSIFEKIFPNALATYGLEEMKTAMVQVIEKEDNITSIQIETNPDVADDVRSMITEAFKTRPRSCNFDVIGTQGFAEAQFRLSWKDGGALHDIDSLAEKICATLRNVVGSSLEKTTETLTEEAPSEEIITSPQEAALPNEQNEDLIDE